MFPSLSKSASASKSFLWTFPECPVRIHVNFEFIERLRREVLEVPSSDREVGGLLIGHTSSPDGDIEVYDYLRLPAGSELIKNFSVCSNSLTKAIQSGRAADQQVVGFYRTHLEPRIQLRAEDLECIRAKFNDPTNVFLVVRPHDGRASAAFFFWQDGSVVGGLTFPFSSTELNSPSWTTLVDGSPRQTALDRVLTRTRETASEISSGTKIGLLVAVAILIALLGALRIYRPSSGRSQTPAQSQTQATSQTLGLRLEKALMGIVIAWNPENPEIATAKDANLLIWDGSSPPAFIRLTTAQLRAGRAFFTSASDRVEVRMDVIGAAGRARTESVVSAARPPDATATSALVPMPKASPLPPATKQSGKEPGPGTRIFTPTAPAPKASSGSTQLPQPPLESPNVGALTQTFHTFNDPQTAPPPHAPEAPAVVRQAPAQQPVPDTPPQPTAPPVAKEPVASSFQAAVPYREIRPQIPAQLKALVQSDNVVEVLVHISASGNVTSAKLVTMNGPVADVLSKLAVNAAMGWQFRPATQNGKAVPSEKTLEFLFRPSGR